MSTMLLSTELDVELDGIFDANSGEEFDADYDEWLAAWTTEAYEAWLDDVQEDNVINVAFETVWRLSMPFQQPANYYADCHGSLDDEPGYLESTAPYLF
jgi:hypothetical protein